MYKSLERMLWCIGVLVSVAQLGVLGVAFASPSPKSPPQVSIPTFQDWKGLQLRSATLELEKIKQEKNSKATDGGPKESSKKDEGDKKTNVEGVVDVKDQLVSEISRDQQDSTVAKDYVSKLNGYAAELQGRLALRSNPKSDQSEAEEKLERAKDLTVVDYVVAHMGAFKENPEAMKLVAARMTPHEVFELMRAYLSLLSPSPQEETIGRAAFDMNQR